MVSLELWYVIAGLVLVVMGLSSSFLHRLPLTTSVIYLAAGLLLGLTIFPINPIEDSTPLHHLAEFAVVVSLFTVGLKLRIEWTDRRWLPPLRLAVISMAVTIGLIAVAGMVGLGLSAGAAILLGAILAPTDPVLASAVEVDDPRDQDQVRLALSGEAGFNDGAAFPFVMLGLGLLGLHDMGPFGWRWAAVDLVWAVIGGLAIGAVLGIAIGRLVVHLRLERRGAVGREEFLTLGLIALAYGGALFAHAYGFLAVFAAGLALRRVEHHVTTGDYDEIAEAVESGSEDAATDPETAPAHMAAEILTFNEQIERIAEVAVVVVIGSLLASNAFSIDLIWFVPLLFLVVRPVATAVGLLGAETGRTERLLVSWFGIRGIGSLYYLMYAIDHGLAEDTARQLTSIVIATVAISVVVHGISVTPIMNRYMAQKES